MPTPHAPRSHIPQGRPSSASKSPGCDRILIQISFCLVCKAVMNPTMKNLQEQVHYCPLKHKINASKKQTTPNMDKHMETVM